MRRMILDWLRRLTPVLITLAILVGLTQCGCARPISPKTPQAATGVTLQALDILTQAGKVATSIRDLERDLQARGVITAEQDARFDVAFAKTQSAADHAIDLIQRGLVTFNEASKAIADTLNDLIVQGQVGIKALVDAIRLLLAVRQVPVPI